MNELRGDGFFLVNAGSWRIVFFFFFGGGEVVCSWEIMDLYYFTAVKIGAVAKAERNDFILIVNTTSTILVIRLFLSGLWKNLPVDYCRGGLRSPSQQYPAPCSHGQRVPAR